MLIIPEDVVASCCRKPSGEATICGAAPAPTMPNSWCPETKRVLLLTQKSAHSSVLRLPAAAAALAPLALIAAGCAASDGDYTDFGHGICNIDGAVENTGTYSDGTYTQEGTYQTHVTEETFTATVTLEDGIVTAVESSADSPNQRSLGLQKAFAGALPAKIVGCPVESVKINVVGGASLTSAEFNNMMDAIRDEAKA
ncbi:hypothetical protein ACFPVT_04085 [Corynebacterium choanae]|uniref:FMN-binding domain-containing protein n=1 Tax=Corynebacterium choanae TaxID=1862358 RepID=A0A3G6JBC1_9CORY|nr:hypothetical protein [Corynebacterium choanae]AZA14368.1 hypothetical protein CCHOA_09925 [Corynebacterium choanae]